MTHKQFWVNPYKTQLQTIITSLDRNIITVAETIFYAETGGQESDTGKIGSYDVTLAQKDGLEIFYTLPREHSLQIGQVVTMQIDWQRRYRLMRLHFAAELILELAYQHIDGITKIGAHISEDKSRIDFEWDEPINAYLPLLHEKATALIRDDEPITSAFDDVENERRYWQIDDFAKVACGGTHINSTGEVGKIKLKRKNIGAGKERIEIYLV